MDHIVLAIAVGAHAAIHAFKKFVVITVAFNHVPMLAAICAKSSTSMWSLP